MITIRMGTYPCGFFLNFNTEKIHMSWDDLPKNIRLKTLKFLYNKKDSILFDSDLYMGLSEAIKELELWCSLEENKIIEYNGTSESFTEKQLKDFFNKLGF